MNVDLLAGATRKWTRGSTVGKMGGEGCRPYLGVWEGRCWLPSSLRVQLFCCQRVSEHFLNRCQCFCYSFQTPLAACNATQTKPWKINQLCLALNCRESSDAINRDVMLLIVGYVLIIIWAGISLNRNSWWVQLCIYRMPRQQELPPQCSYRMPRQQDV